jgi:hypothetical protein
MCHPIEAEMVNRLDIANKADDMELVDNVECGHIE